MTESIASSLMPRDPHSVASDTWSPQASQALCMRVGRMPKSLGRGLFGVAVSIAVGVLSLAGCGRAPDVARHLVLVTVDTWRADHFDTELAGSALTPGLSTFADSGIRFSQAHSVASETSPGIAGILTGLIPRRSGVILNVHMLAPEVPTLATILSAAGFTTAAVIANPVLRPGMGFENGFASYELVRVGPGEPKARADEVTDAALARFDSLSVTVRDRIFLWVHYLDPHGPYAPPQSARALFPTEAFDGPINVPLLPADDNSGRGGVPAYQQYGRFRHSRDARDYLARYAAEVRFMDQEVTRLLDELTSRGVLDDAIVVITSDHGEALVDDHGFFFSHGHGVTQDQVHVPLVLRCPDCVAGGTIGRPVSTLDVVPTVLSGLGVTAPAIEELDGTHLLTEANHTVYAAAAREISLREGAWKAIWQRNSSAWLFRLTDDPWEANDLSAAHPERLAELANRLRDLTQREPLAEPRSRPSRREPVERRLQALGYL